ncbi:unnamed protein product [Callosobruchus maculatus]|uniref:ATP-binding cassette sub-family B member 6 N-terminal five TM domain-containing protein n=1 Tax=Callosobruchus maculatus TaxID=64391 RepID=A0A653DE48_CALMS|nr:unnamed protein product [Callosobruchus maculatus]
MYPKHTGGERIANTSTKQKSRVKFENIAVDVNFKERSDNQSTWKNFWKKAKILSPFLWPKKDFSLQFRVIVCFLLLAAGRVVNLYLTVWLRPKKK